MLPREEILEGIERFKKEAALEDERCYHKDRYSNPYEREWHRLQTLLEVHDTEVQYEDGPSGCILIKRPRKGDIVYSLSTGKWRVKGKAKWYRSGDVTKFINKYVKNEV